MAPGPLRHGLTLYALAECLFSGAAFHGTAKFEALQIARAIADTSVCRLVVVPSMLSALAPLFAQVIPNDLQSIIVAGSRLEGRLVTAIRAAVPSVEVIEYYGASELGFVSLRSLTSDPFPNSVGYAFPGVNIRTRAHGGRLCLPGEPGTIYVRSPLISDGYVFGDDGKGLRRDGAWATVGDSGILDLAAIIHEKCAIKAKPLISFTTMRMGCLMKFFAMKSLAQVFGGLGRFRAVR